MLLVFTARFWWELDHLADFFIYRSVHKIFKALLPKFVTNLNLVSPHFRYLLSPSLPPPPHFPPTITSTSPLFLHRFTHLQASGGKSGLSFDPRAGPWPEQHCFTHLYPLSNLDHKGREFAAPSFWRGWISGGGRGGKPGSLLPWVGCSSPTIWLRIVRRDDDLILSRLCIFLPEDGLVPALSDEGALGSGWEGEECRWGFWLL